jgi:hypothetical protein
MVRDIIAQLNLLKRSYQQTIRNKSKDLHADEDENSNFTSCSSRQLSNREYYERLLLFSSIGKHIAVTCAHDIKLKSISLQSLSNG